jgi:hypothetical protein
MRNNLACFRFLLQEEDLRDPDRLEQKISTAHPYMSQVLKSYGIPVTALLSQESAWNALSRIQEHLDSVNLREAELREKQARLEQRQLGEIHNVINASWKATKDELYNNPEDKLIQKLETSLAEKKAQLTFYAANKTKLTQVKT